MYTLLYIAACVVIIMLFTAHPFALAFSEIIFITSVLICIKLAPRNLGILSWRAGIPSFYLLYFFVFPLVTGNIEKISYVSLYIATGGILAFLLGSLMMGSLGKKHIYKFGLLDWKHREKTVFVFFLIGLLAKIWSYFFGYFGLVSSEDASAGGFAGIISALSFFLTIANVIAWNTYFRTGNMIFIATFSTLTMVFVGLVSNSKASILLPFLYIALSSWAVRGKVPLKMIGSGVLFYSFIVLPYTTATRLYTSLAGYEVGKLEQLQFALYYFTSLQWVDNLTAVFLVRDAALSTLDRGLLTYFDSIIEKTGDTINYLNGETILQGIGTMIPRFLYPDKSNMDISHWTALRYGEIASNDTATNVAPTYMGEFYMNFGIFGVLFGMFFVGILAVMVDRYLIGQKKSWTLPILMYMVIWQEGVMGHTLFAFLKELLFLIPVFIIVERILRKSRLSYRPL